MTDKPPFEPWTEARLRAEIVKLRMLGIPNYDIDFCRSEGHSIDKHANLVLYWCGDTKTFIRLGRRKELTLLEAVEIINDQRLICERATQSSPSKTIP